MSGEIRSLTPNPQPLPRAAPREAHACPAVISSYRTSIITGPQARPGPPPTASDSVSPPRPPPTKMLAFQHAERLVHPINSANAYHMLPSPVGAPPHLPARALRLSTRRPCPWGPFLLGEPSCRERLPETCAPHGGKRPARWSREATHDLGRLYRASVHSTSGGAAPSGAFVARN